VKPGNHEKLIVLLNEATVQTMRFREGFISANTHRGLDDKHVANYAQRESKQAFFAMLKDPTAQEHMRKAEDLCEKIEPNLYKVDTTHQRP
jgi:hypothetical protein